MKKLIPLFLALLITACDQKRPQQSSVEPPAAKKESAPDRLFSLEKTHVFSDPSALDTFKLDVTGKDVLTATIQFRIISPAGTEIYNEQFTGNYLIDYEIMEGVEDPQIITDSTRRVYIQNRLKQFFDVKNFRKPAIKTDARYEDQNTSRELFDELKANPEAWSFYYLLGKEDGRYIAWSEKFQRVMMFYNCC
ncbi:MAG TPA: hypothetical protein VGD90_10315 [Sphingobacteriaceae bacterium]